ncbi:hypothetical protein Q31b_09060 [Novipirellula aureliae]|uniref:Uncharacterized protein n=1 Tax=Novipirellula aureliae TaxID=2527966 RepID=A0A5C6EAH7_9BACT|nr:hypothetical protein [Novipirellula aureliae]TWU45730.1 hypothetical protein Q31b_09060 [Novipirellula aureliae]
MTPTNPQIEKQLNELANLCCETLDGDEAGLNARSKPILKALLMSGYVRKQGNNLRSEVESRAKSRCRDAAMHRGGALSGITRKLQQQFDDLVRFESQQPTDQTDAKAANISSATDA